MSDELFSDVVTGAVQGYTETIHMLGFGLTRFFSTVLKSACDTPSPIASHA